MPNDKNHLYSNLDATKDRKYIEKRKTQQAFSRFSTAATTGINNANLLGNSPPLQTNTKPQIGMPYDDTRGSIGLVSAGIFLDVYGSTYSFFTLTGDVDFSFANLPTGRYIQATLDLTVNQVAGVAITFPQVTNPPVLAGNDGDRYVLTFIGVNRVDPTGVASPVLTWTFVSGTTSSGIVSPLTNKGDIWGYDTGNARIPVGLTNGHVLTVDSTAALGVSWQAGGAGTSPPFVDTDPLIKGSDDATKLLRFEIDGFDTLTTRVITIPNATTTMAGLGVSLQQWAGVNQFFGNTMVRDTNFFIQNTVDITKQMKFDLAGATIGKTLTITSNHTDFRTVTIPNQDTALAGLDVTLQTWSGTNRFLDQNLILRHISEITATATFDLSAIPAATNRVYSVPNSTTTLAGLGVVSQTWTGANTFVGSTIFTGTVTLGRIDFDDGHSIASTPAALTVNMNGIGDDFDLQWASDTKQMKFENNHITTKSDTTAYIFESLYNKTTIADNEAIAAYQWNARTVGGIPVTKVFAQMVVVANDLTTGTEDSDLDFYVMDNGTLIKIMQLDGSINTVDFVSGANLQLNGGSLQGIADFAIDGGAPSVTGSRGGNVALASLLSELETLGIITDNTTV